MRAAYLAHDKTALNSLRSLSHYFKHIDFYFVDTEMKTQLVDSEKLTLMLDTYSINSDPQLQTHAQKIVLEGVKTELNHFKNHLAPPFKNNQAPPSENHKIAEFNIYQMATIKDLFFNHKTNDVLIEQDKVGLKDYKYLFIEDHQIVAENLMTFSKNVFKVSPQNSHIWFSIQFEYELKKPRENFLDKREFIFVQNYRVQSLIDNWVICRFEENKLSVEQWVPFNQHKNSDFQKFIAERAEKMIRQKFHLVHIVKVNECRATSAPGFSLKVGQLKNTKISSMIAGLHFYSEHQINQLIQSKFGPRLNLLTQLSQNLNQQVRGSL